MRAHKSCAVYLRVEIVAGNGENDLPSCEISQNDGCFFSGIAGCVDIQRKMQHSATIPWARLLQRFSNATALSIC
jgi:hypothetical protein